MLLHVPIENLKRVVHDGDVRIHDHDVLPRRCFDPQIIPGGIAPVLGRGNQLGPGKFIANHFGRPVAGIVIYHNRLKFHIRFEQFYPLQALFGQTLGFVVEDDDGEVQE